MSAVAAPGAVSTPVAPAPNGANGAAKPNGASPPAPGQPPGGPAVAGEAPASPPYRFKKALKVAGKEVSVDLDEAGLTRELQVKAHLQTEYQRLSAEAKQRAELDALLEADPLEYLRRRGKNPDDILLTEAQRQSQMAEMTPEQQRIATLERQLEQHQAASKKQAETAKQQAEAARKAVTRQRTAATLMESLKHVGFAIDGPENAHFRGQALKMAAKMQRASIQHTGIEMDAQQLGAAVQRRYLEGVGRTAKMVSTNPEFRKAHAPVLGQLLQTMTEGLEGQALLEVMGPKLIRALITAQTQQLGQRGGVVVGGTQAAAPSYANQQRPPNQPAPGLDPYAHRKKW